MDKETIAKMQTTLSGMKTKAEEVKAGAKDVEPSSTSQTILDTLTKKILGESGAVSSQQTGVEKVMSEATASAEAIRAAGAKRIGMEAEEGAVTIREAGERRLTSAREAQRGFGTNTAALKAIQDSTTKQLADLDKRKDQALLENNTALADKISNLQLKAIDFQQKAEQQAFSNALGIGKFELDVKQEERLRQAAEKDQFEIVGSPKEGIYSITVDPETGQQSIETLLEPQEQQGIFEDRFLTLSEVEKLNDRGVDINLGDRLSDVEDTGETQTVTEKKAAQETFAVNTIIANAKEEFFGKKSKLKSGVDKLELAAAIINSIRESGKDLVVSLEDILKLIDDTLERKLDLSERE